MPNRHTVQSTVRQSTIIMHNTVVFGHFTDNNAWGQPDLSGWFVPTANEPSEVVNARSQSIGT